MFELSLRRAGKAKHLPIAIFRTNALLLRIRALVESSAATVVTVAGATEADIAAAATPATSIPAATPGGASPPRLASAGRLHMRQFALIGLVLVAASGYVSGIQAPPGSVLVRITAARAAGGSAGVGATRGTMYTGAPFASVRASAPLTGNAPEGLSFGVRAWKQGPNTIGVVVYAVLDDRRAPTGQTETPISTFTIAPGQTVEVPETEKWGASRVSVTAEQQ